ncbi:MAG: hypothetical protein IJ455_02810 [Agathobacter sp.]|nr:hypothetical protein [Agathobacter sp.]
MFACPNCGGNLKFDIRTQNLGCEHCQTQMDVYSFEDKEPNAPSQSEYDVTVFTCPQCGGEILSTDTSAAEFCSFCGASTILYSRLTKEKRPNYIIPFQKTKEDCKQAYSEMMKKAIFAPDALKNPKYIDGFRGIYMPYWAFYMTQEGEFTLNGSKSKRRGDYIYTDHYELKGEIDAYYKGLSYDASSSFDDNISEKIAPYDVKGMKTFTPAFLSGFYADTADVDASTYETDAENIANSNSIGAIYQEFSGVDVEPLLTPSALNTQTKAIDSAMFPVWFMSYRNAGRVAYATVNGQTGKVVTDLPIDVKKYVKGSLLLALPIFLLLNLLFTITPSTLLIVVAILAIISIIIYSTEIAAIKKKEALQTKKSALFSSIFAIVLCAIVGILQPANDIFYYGAVIASLLAIFYSFKDIIEYYNILATRRLPQFDRTGGDDRA